MKKSVNYLCVGMLMCIPAVALAASNGVGRTFYNYTNENYTVVWKPDLKVYVPGWNYPGCVSFPNSACANNFDIGEKSGTTGPGTVKIPMTYYPFHSSDSPNGSMAGHLEIKYAGGNFVKTAQGQTVGWGVKWQSGISLHGGWFEVDITTPTGQVKKTRFVNNAPAYGDIKICYTGGLGCG